jgi:hypothetical protein
MLDALVCCLRHDGHPPLSCFPQVRGVYLAKHLARTGLRAAFEPLPCRSRRARVLICSEYQGDADWLAFLLRRGLDDIHADRLYCLTEFSLGGREHESKAMTEWFGARGGVLCHLADRAMESYERHIGVGVDLDVVRFDPEATRNTIVFDFPVSSTVDQWRTKFDLDLVDRIRARYPGSRVVGTGEAHSPLRSHFDRWIPYRTPHPEYVKATFGGCAAFVPGHVESMGLAACEAQVAGACIVYRPGYVKAEVLCNSADLPFTNEDELIAALGSALASNGASIAHEAAERFDYRRVAMRAKEATGL